MEKEEEEFFDVIITCKIISVEIPFNQDFSSQRVMLINNLFLSTLLFSYEFSLLSKKTPKIRIVSEINVISIFKSML